MHILTRQRNGRVVWVCVHDNCSHGCDSCEFFSCSVNVSFTPTPLFMYFVSVGLSSHLQKTGDGDGSDEEKTAGDMDVDDCHELR